MLDITGLNVAAIVVSWLITVIIGGLWYSPIGFGKYWSKLSGVDMMQTPKNESNRAIISVSIASLIYVIILAVIINSLHITDISRGLITGLVIWTGFIAATTVGNNLYARLSWKFWWLNASYFLVTTLLCSMLLSIW